MTPYRRRGTWTPQEDQMLLQLIRERGSDNWEHISQCMGYRSPKQCRERFRQSLRPSLKHGPISEDEGRMIEGMVNEIGKHWAQIARRLGNRSDNAVKNWWNSSMNRKKHSTSQSKAIRTHNGRTKSLCSGFANMGSYLQHPYLPNTTWRSSRVESAALPVDFEASSVCSEQCPPNQYSILTVGLNEQLPPICTLLCDPPMRCSSNSPRFSEASEFTSMETYRPSPDIEPLEPTWKPTLEQRSDPRRQPGFASWVQVQGAMANACQSERANPPGNTRVSLDKLLN